VGVGDLAGGLQVVIWLNTDGLLPSHTPAGQLAQLLGQNQQVLNPEEGPPRRYDDERVSAANVRPTRWNRLNRICSRL
jgi:hypothetical protein